MSFLGYKKVISLYTFNLGCFVRLDLISVTYFTLKAIYPGYNDILSTSYISVWLRSFYTRI
jgi:hypothetical protein